MTSTPEETNKMAEAIGRLSSAISHLDEAHSNMLKQNTKVCWYIKTSKDRQEVLRQSIEGTNRKLGAKN